MSEAQLQHENEQLREENAQLRVDLVQAERDHQGALRREAVALAQLENCDETRLELHDALEAASEDLQFAGKRASDAERELRRLKLVRNRDRED